MLRACYKCGTVYGCFDAELKKRRCHRCKLKRHCTIRVYPTTEEISHGLCVNCLMELLDKIAEKRRKRKT